MITRRGQEIAVLVSAGDFATVMSSQAMFGSALNVFLSNFSPPQQGLTESEFPAARSKEGGREVSFD